MKDKQKILEKEIDLIQASINRMANNSFLLKGWTISLITVVLALSKENQDWYIISLILLIPVLSFWYLDAFFLRTERMYRKMYEWVIENRLLSDDNIYDLNPNRFSKEVNNHFKVMLSKTLIAFYGIASLVIVTIIYKTW